MRTQTQQYEQLYREWDPVLGQLKQMGFEDRRRNIDLILAHRGSMVDVVEQLLHSSGAADAPAAP
jgi:hypothetical protein